MSDDLRDRIAAVLVTLQRDHLCRHDGSGGDCEDLGPEHHWEFRHADAVLVVRDEEMERLLGAVKHWRAEADAWASGRWHRADDVAALKNAEQRAEQAETAVERVRDLHVRNANTGDCEHCSERDYPDYAVPWPCPTIAALDQPAKEEPDAVE